MQISTIEAYLKTFINWKTNNKAKFLLIAEFFYKNSKNASISYLPFKINYSYYICVFFEEKVNLCSKFLSADTLAMRLKDLMTIFQQNLLYVEKM